MSNNAVAVAAKDGTQRSQRPIAVVAAFLALVLGTSILAFGSGSSSSAKVKSGNFELTSAELTDWQSMTATPVKRAEVLTKLQAAFAGVAQVDVGKRPAAADVNPTATAHTSSDMATAPGEMVLDAQLILAYGISGNHFWLTASYADMAQGAIWGAAWACVYRFGLPSWLCNGAANQLSNWASGWGSASNHGVWGELFWAPPYYRLGRW